MSTTITRFGPVESEVAHTTDRNALFADAAFQERLAAYADDDLPYSFLCLDAFDTLMLRNTKCEPRRFHEIAARVSELTGSQSADDALVSRLLATRVAYRTSAPIDGCREGTLADIHRLWAGLRGDPPSVAEATVEIEMEYEVENLTPNSAIAELARRHVERGGRVLVVSDMYLGVREIAWLVERVHPGLEIDKIYSSADYKVSKRSGGIFALIEEEWSRPGEDFLMIGDALLGDYQRPLRAGWKAIHLPIPDELQARINQDFYQLIDELAVRGVGLGDLVREPS